MMHTGDKRMDLTQYQQNIESYLNQILPAASTTNDLAIAMRYSVLDAGKRLRPCLVYATGELLGVEQNKLHAAAAALELIHCYSLIHDDLPAMDDDDLRRGKPSCHRAFSESTAILAGDALQALAFEVLADADRNPIPAAQRIAQVKILAKAAGAVGMVLGQADDIAAEQQSIPLNQLNTIHQRKTGALFGACVAMAHQASNQYTDDVIALQLKSYAEHLGLLFQIQDDILDVVGNPKLLGKAVNADHGLAKATYPGLLGLATAKEHAQAALQSAIAALDNFGTTAMQLRNIANFALNRVS